MSEGKRNQSAHVYGDSSPKYYTVTQSAEFKHGRYSLEDDPRPGCSQEMTDRVERLSLNDC